MKIILLQDVKNLGKKGELVEANDGYARNFIIPKKLGVEASPKNLNDLRQQKLNEEKKQAEILAEAQKIAEELKDKVVKLSIRVGKEGKVFGQISTKEIADAAKKQFGLEIDKKKMVSEGIKAAGTYKIAVKLHPKVTGELTVEVAEEV
ncbi:MAG: 50S ribosomal protein L9 [Catonella sp.]|uniref:50S ribosomal protein L9 n=1 Tax=Catonella sp. TaxID=2382125 RepID=UPI003FA1211E